MERCRDCNAILKADERECLRCGARVKAKKPGGIEHVAAIVKMMGWLSFGLLIVSLLVRQFLNPVLCLLATASFFLLSRNLDSFRRPPCVWCGREIPWGRLLRDRDRQFCAESHRVRFEQLAVSRMISQAEHIPEYD